MCTIAQVFSDSFHKRHSPQLGRGTLQSVSSAVQAKTFLRSQLLYLLTAMTEEIFASEQISLRSETARQIRSPSKEDYEGRTFNTNKICASSSVAPKTLDYSTPSNINWKSVRVNKKHYTQQGQLTSLKTIG